MNRITQRRSNSYRFLSWREKSEKDKENQFAKENKDQAS